MNSWTGPEILAQDNAHIHPTKRVGLYQNFSGPEHCSYGAGTLRIPPPNDDSSEACR